MTSPTSSVCVPDQVTVTHGPGLSRPADSGESLTSTRVPWSFRSCSDSGVPVDTPAGRIDGRTPGPVSNHRFYVSTSRVESSFLGTTVPGTSPPASHYESRGPGSRGGPLTRRRPHRLPPPCSHTRDRPTVRLSLGVVCGEPKPYPSCRSGAVLPSTRPTDTRGRN